MKPLSPRTRALRSLSAQLSEFIARRSTFVALAGYALGRRLVHVFRDELARLKHDNVEFIVVRHARLNGRLSSAYRSYLVDQPYFADRHLEAHRIDDLLAARLPCDGPPSP